MLRCHTEWGQLREEVKRAEGDPTMARQDVEKVTMIIVIRVVVVRIIGSAQW